MRISLYMVASSESGKLLEYTETRHAAILLAQKKANLLLQDMTIYAVSTRVQVTEDNLSCKVLAILRNEPEAWEYSTEIETIRPQFYWEQTRSLHGHPVYELRVQDAVMEHPTQSILAKSVGSEDTIFYMFDGEIPKEVEDGPPGRALYRCYCYFGNMSDACLAGQRRYASRMNEEI